MCPIFVINISISHTFEFISHDSDQGSNFTVMWQVDRGKSKEALEQVNEQKILNCI